MNIGEKIKHIRKDHKLNQEAFGKLIGISKNAVWNYENNKRTPSLDILKKMSKALNVPITELIDINKSELGEEDGMNKNYIDVTAKIEEGRRQRAAKTMTPKQFAEEYNVGLKTAYRIIHAEGFPVIFVGRKALIIRSKVDEWLENNISKCF